MSFHEKGGSSIEVVVTGMLACTDVDLTARERGFDVDAISGPFYVSFFGCTWVMGITSTSGSMTGERKVLNSKGGLYEKAQKVSWRLDTPCEGSAFAFDLQEVRNLSEQSNLPMALIIRGFVHRGLAELKV
jgi:hypothetical protein